MQRTMQDYIFRRICWQEHVAKSSSSSNHLRSPRTWAGMIFTYFKNKLAKLDHFMLLDWP